MVIERKWRKSADTCELLEGSQENKKGNKDDRGVIAVMDQVIGTPWENVVMRDLPRGAKIKTLEHR